MGFHLQISPAKCWNTRTCSCWIMTPLFTNTDFLPSSLPSENLLSGMVLAVGFPANCYSTRLSSDGRADWDLLPHGYLSGRRRSRVQTDSVRPSSVVGPVAISPSQRSGSPLSLYLAQPITTSYSVFGHSRLKQWSSVTQRRHLPHCLAELPT